MLNVVSFEEAKRITNENYVLNSRSETIDIGKAVGSITCENIISKENIPAFDRSTVDGYAVISKDTYGSGESMPSILNIRGEILMGEKAGFDIKSGECVKISTGGMLPGGADAVVMVENTENDNDELCLVFKAVSPFENVTKCGDDTKSGSVVIKEGTKLTSRHIGVLAAMGYDRIPVKAMPTVGIISTGDEIVEITKTPAVGEIRDVNSHLLAAMVEEAGCKAEKAGIIKDNYDAVFSAVKTAAEKYDMVLISGGSSAGVRDMTAGIIAELGEVYAHGVAVKPGKPTIIGKINEKPVFGLPGHPAAAFFVTETLILPMLRRNSDFGDSTAVLPLKSNISSNHGREEFICIKIEDGLAVPKYAKSGIISTLSESDGYIIVDRNAEGIKTGEKVTVHLFR